MVSLRTNARLVCLPFFMQTDASDLFLWKIRCEHENLFAEGLRAENWTSLLPSSDDWEPTLHMVSDDLNTTCTQLDLSGGEVLLRGQLSLDMNSLHVTMIMGSSVAFGPGPVCQPMASSLLIQRQSDCGQNFCVIPATCHYLGNTVISTDPTLWQYDFICICGQPVCMELLLWLRVDSAHDRVNHPVNLCAIVARPWWRKHDDVMGLLPDT